MNDLCTVPNPDLLAIEGNKSRWTHASHRRRGLHNLHRIARYGMSFRAARVLPLETRADIVDRDYLSAMASMLKSIVRE